MCDLCSNPHRIGVDTFVCENEEGVLVKNARSIVTINGYKFKTKKRYSFAIHEHVKDIPTRRGKKITTFIRKKLKELYNIDHSDVWFFVTMNTFAEHWHIHACVKPITPISEATGLTQSIVFLQETSCLLTSRHA